MISQVNISLCNIYSKVSYENHKHFSSTKKSKKPSPVRLFTNLPLPGPRLPRSEGYHLCKLCRRYVAPNNAHCPFCDGCTSKASIVEFSSETVDYCSVPPQDGRRYRHCSECGVCVKPARVHCRLCNSCQLPDHLCGDRSFSLPPSHTQDHTCLPSVCPVFAGP